MATDAKSISVGAPGEGSGAAYVFARLEGTWAEQARVAWSDAVPYGQLGMSVAIDGDAMAIGSTGELGSVDIYSRVSEAWTWQSSPEDRRRWRATSLDLVEDRLWIGNPGWFSTSGRVRVWRRRATGWQVEAELEPGLASFGASIAAHGDTLIVGEWDDRRRSEAGAVFRYTLTAGKWSRAQRLY